MLHTHTFRLLFITVIIMIIVIVIIAFIQHDTFKCRVHIFWLCHRHLMKANCNCDSGLFSVIQCYIFFVFFCCCFKCKLIIGLKKKASTTMNMNVWTIYQRWLVRPGFMVKWVKWKPVLLLTVTEEAPELSSKMEISEAVNEDGRLVQYSSMTTFIL